MRLSLFVLVAVLPFAAGCSSADGQTQPSGAAFTRAVLAGTTDATGAADITLPSQATTAGALPLVQVYAQDGTSWNVVADGDGTATGNGNWTLEVPSSAAPVVHLRDAGSRNVTAPAPISYKVVVIY